MRGPPLGLASITLATTFHDFQLGPVKPQRCIASTSDSIAIALGLLTRGRAHLGEEIIDVCACVAVAAGQAL